MTHEPRIKFAIVDEVYGDDVKNLFCRDYAALKHKIHPMILKIISDMPYNELIKLVNISCDGILEYTSDGEPHITIKIIL